MFGLMKKLAKWYLSRPVEYLQGGASGWLTEMDDYSIVTSNSPKAYFNDIFDKKGIFVIKNPPIEVVDLDLLIPSISTKWIVGIGGGRVNDASKYLAKKAGKKLCLIPSILSTTSWLNMAIALRENNKLVFPCEKHANKIIIDPSLIQKAPSYLNVGGIADLLCCASAIHDWKLDNDLHGTKFSKNGFDAFLTFIDDMVSNPELFNPFNQKSIEQVYEIFLKALCLCGASASGRPLEGSEHYMYYYLDEISSEKIIHGAIIALTTLISLILHENMPLFKKLKSFFDKVGIRYKPIDLGLSNDTIESMLKKMDDFTKDRNLEFTILNKKKNIDVEKLLSTINA